MRKMRRSVLTAVATVVTATAGLLVPLSGTAAAAPVGPAAPKAADFNGDG